MRPKVLQDFYDALDLVLLHDRGAYEGRHVPEMVLATTARVGEIVPPAARTPPDAVALVASICAAAAPPIRPVCDALARLVPHLNWTSREVSDPTASADFSSRHANAVVLGASGYERSDDFTIGVSIAAPGAVYPIHSHPPEELYLILTESAFYNTGKPWAEHSPGQTFYNEPGIFHAMRAETRPMLAIWIFGCQ